MLNVVTTYWNTAGFCRPLANYFTFAKSLADQNVNLITVELSFNGKFSIPKNKNVIRVCGDEKNILWQKERLINLATSYVDDKCKYIAWVDCDVMFSNDDWSKWACRKLEEVDIIQLYERVFYLPKDNLKYNGRWDLWFESVLSQKCRHPKTWLQQRIEKKLKFSAPGFAWAAKREFFDKCGIYDKNIVGSGDTFFVDCMLDSFAIHGYAEKFNMAMREDMMAWCSYFRGFNFSYGYIPVDIYHLWHGSLSDRKYMDRHEIVKKHSYDPRKDVVLKNNLYEWSTNKPQMHQEIKEYFFARREDGEDSL